MLLTSTSPGPDLQPNRPHAIGDCPRTAYGPGRTVEGRQKAVAGGVNLPATEALELHAHLGVVALEQLAPALVAE